MTVEINVARLREAVDFVRATHVTANSDNPEGRVPVLVNGVPAVHDQSVYSALGTQVDTFPHTAQEQAQIDMDPSLNTCGTAYCVAGYLTATTPGYKADLILKRQSLFDPFSLRETVDGTVVDSHDDIAARAIFPWYAEACENDRFTNEQENAVQLLFDLFDGANSLETIVAIATDLAGEPI